MKTCTLPHVFHSRAKCWWLWGRSSECVCWYTCVWLRLRGKGHYHSQGKHGMRAQNTEPSACCCKDGVVIRQVNMMGKVLQQRCYDGKTSKIKSCYEGREKDCSPISKYSRFAGESFSKRGTARLHPFWSHKWIAFTCAPGLTRSFSQVLNQWFRLWLYISHTITEV